MKIQFTILCILVLKISLIVTSCSKPSTLPTPDKKVRDLAFDGKYLWVAGSHNNKIYQLSKTGKVLTEINSPSDSPRGLTWDGEYLWVSTGLIDGTIYQIDTSGKVLKEFEAPSNKPSGLAWVNGYLFYVEVHGAESYKGIIYKLDPQDGSVLDSFDSPGDRNEGLGYDSERTYFLSHQLELCCIRSIQIPGQLWRKKTRLFAVQRELLGMERTSGFVPRQRT